MKVLVLGIAGPLGRLVATGLQEDGHTVAGIDRRGSAKLPEGIAVYTADIRKRPAEEIFRRFSPDVVVHMATVSHFAARTEERHRINVGGTRAVFDHCDRWGVQHAVFVGRHTYYGADADSPLYHSEDEPPMGLASYPELADLVAADLYAGSALWRLPKLDTTVLRLCYTLGKTGSGTLATYLRGRRVPTVLGFDPLFQFMHELDAAAAIRTAVQSRPRGVFNVAGPAPLPLSVIVREAGRTQVPLPEPLYAALLGRLGLPRLPRGAIEHIKHAIVVDAAHFSRVTGFRHRFDERTTLREFRDAFPLA